MVSAPQPEHLSQLEHPSNDCMSPLETATPLTVIAHFPVFKTASAHQRFLQLEHGHPTFVGYLNPLPRR